MVVYALARRAYNEPLAFLAVAYLAVSGFFFKIATTAWSETTGIAFLALAFYLVALDRSTRARQLWIPIAAGVAACLALYARYALLPMAGVAGLLLIERKDARATLRNWALFGGAYLMVALPLLLRNAHLSDTVLGPHRPASDVGLLSNLARLYLSTATSVLAPFQLRSVARWLLPAEWLLVTLAVLSVLVGLFFRRFRARVRGGLHPSFLGGKRYVFTAWALGYLAYIVVYRSYTHFDPLDARLLAPGLVPLAVPVTAFLAGFFRLSETGLRRWTAGFLVLGLAMAGAIAFALPVTDYSKWVARSERMSWVYHETTARDLVIGDGLMDVTALDPARTVLLFDITSVPSLQLRADTLFAVVRKHCGDYDRTFLVLSKHRPRGGWKATRGQFLADLMEGRLDAYPGVTLVREMGDGYVFRIACPAE